MGKRTKLREAEKFAADQALAARLRDHRERSSDPGYITAYDQFPDEFHGRIEPYLRNAIRDPKSWRSALRVKSPELRFLEFVRFTFAKFSVPAFLEQAWLPAHAETGDRPEFRDWYIAAAQGLSLYREQAAEMLTRAETHHFLAAPARVGSARAALWYAIARSATRDASVALQIARSPLVDRFPGDDFWKEVARYFARNRASLREMEELIDYLDAVRNADVSFTLAGRSLAALRRRRQDWLRLCEAGDPSGPLRWSGAALKEVVIERHGTVWHVSQIRTALRLLDEAERMRHCVFAYRGSCAAGYSSIWSVTSEAADGRRRHLTIEVDSDGTILQCRGFANRVPTRTERDIVRHWADANNLVWNEYDEVPEVA